EATTNTNSDLAIAENTAANLGAITISNSYGSPDSSGDSYYDQYYNHPGIAVVASSGDTGNVVEYPSSSNYVLAVGGTTLQLNSDNSYRGEQVWSGTGSGCSSGEIANSWQLDLPNWNATGCKNSRATVDVSADANPNTGAAVYITYPGNSGGNWYQFGGTSLSSPIIAGVIALAGGIPANSNVQQIPYLNYSTSNFHDVTTGSNG